MQISRRTFTGGAMSAALGPRLSAAAFARTSPELATAIGAIRAYGEAHLRYNYLPGMTLGLATPDGARTVLNFGYANADARTSITPDTLFQIGSISKSMVGVVIHQLAAEGKLKLTDRLSELLPAVPLPSGNRIAIQHLLDHVAGLPEGAPVFPQGGLWTTYAPGEHWHYSNVAYEILGKLVEHVGGKPLASALHGRFFSPLGMTRSRGAIIGADRSFYAQGYEPADQVVAYARGMLLAPAPWVDVTAGAGCVASTADDMLPFLRALAQAVQGKGALGLSPEQARTFTTHAVPTDSSAMSYGNGLMHVGDAGRSYLHHTGGMLSFSSSFHVDVESGVGAFASSTLNAFPEYRPRLLTRFAVDALTNSMRGRALPTPPSLRAPLANPAAYVGRYSGPAGDFEVRADTPLTIVADGTAASLEPTSDEIFRTTHPRFRNYSLQFERHSGRVSLANWGPNIYARYGATVAFAKSDPALAKLAGRYINDNPWFGPAPVVERGGKLWIGTETPMSQISDNLWRVGKESWSPERASFADFIDGRPQTLIWSGVSYTRHAI